MSNTLTSRLTNTNGDPIIPIAVFEPDVPELTPEQTTPLTCDAERRLRVTNEQPIGVQSSQDDKNTTTESLVAGQTWTGDWTDTNGFAQIVTAFKATQDGTFTMEFSSDGATAQRTIGPYTLPANTDSPQPLAPIRRFYRASFTNISESTAVLNIETTLRTFPGLFKTRLQDAPGPLSPADLTRAVLFGKTEGGGVQVNGSMTAEGHAEIAVVAPRTAFGELAVASDVPGIQRSHFQYGFNARLDRRRLIGSATYDKGTGNEKTLMIASTGTTPGSIATGGSSRREVYFAGMGKKIEFTTRFTTPTAGTEQWMGLGDERDGLALGCDGETVGLRHWYFGQHEVRTLEIATAANAVENATITLDGQTKVVALINASGNKNITANAIAAADYSTVGNGWDAYSYASGSSVYVVFVSHQAKPLTGTYSLTSTGATIGTFTRTMAGVVPTVEWIPQTQWEYDRFDGASTPTKPVLTNPSGFELDPTDLGVYKLSIQYLGNGDLLFFVENPTNGQFCAAHLIARAGQFAQTSFGNMALPITLYASNGATSTDVRVATASYYAANEGERIMVGTSVPVGNLRTGITSEVAIISIRNPLVWNGEPNTIPLIITHFDLTNTGGTGMVTWRFVRNGTLGSGATATASFAQADETSPVLVDTTYVGSVIGGTRTGLAYQAPNQGTQRIFDHKGTDAGRVYPGETVTLVASVNTGAAITCGAALNIRADQ